MTCKLFRMFKRNEDGTAAVEFALVLPVFLVLLLGIIAYGIYFAAAHSTAQLAADAARASVAGRSDADRATRAKANVASNISGYGMLLDPAKITVDAAPLASDPNQFRVAIRYDAANLPIWSFTPFLPLPSKIIEQSAVIARGGFQ